MVAPSRFTPYLGYNPAASTLTPGTFALNLAANWNAFSFVADSARTIDNARLNFSAVNGTLGGSDITLDLYASDGTSSSPGTVIESGKLPTAAISAATWFTFTGFNTVATPGQQYWFVLKNVNGTPATNNCTSRYTGTYTNAPFGSTARQSWAQAASANSGSTWSVTNGRSALRVGYADGTFDGIPIHNAQAALIGDGIYATRESGNIFTMYGNLRPNVIGIAMTAATKTGSPTGAQRFGLWTGSTPSLQAYTNSLPTTAGTTNQWLYSYFSSTVVIEPGTVCRVTQGETAQADASGNRFNNYENFFDSQSDSAALMSFNGTLQKTYFNGSTWAETAGSAFPFALLLDPTTPFASSASGGIIGS